MAAPSLSLFGEEDGTEEEDIFASLAAPRTSLSSTATGSSSATSRTTTAKKKAASAAKPKTDKDKKAENAIEDEDDNPFSFRAFVSEKPAKTKVSLEQDRCEGCTGNSMEGRARGGQKRGR